MQPRGRAQGLEAWSQVSSLQPRAGWLAGGVAGWLASRGADALLTPFPVDRGTCGCLWQGPTLGGLLGGTKGGEWGGRGLQRRR